MARLPRIVIPGLPHLVTQRGNRQERTFFNDGDYKAYRQLIAEAADRARTEIWAYCLMPNHVHMILVPADHDGLRGTLAEAHRRYTTRVNRRNGWTGCSSERRVAACEYYGDTLLYFFKLRLRLPPAPLRSDVEAEPGLQVVEEVFAAQGAADGFRAAQFHRGFFGKFLFKQRPEGGYTFQNGLDGHQRVVSSLQVRGHA